MWLIEHFILRKRTILFRRTDSLYLNIALIETTRSSQNSVNSERTATVGSLDLLVCDDDVPPTTTLFHMTL